METFNIEFLQLCVFGCASAFLLLKLPVVQHCPLGTSGGQEELLQSLGTVLLRARWGQDPWSEAGEEPALSYQVRTQWQGAGGGHRSPAWVLARLEAQTMGTEFQVQLEASLKEVRRGLEKVSQVEGDFSRTLPFLSLSL